MSTITRPQKVLAKVIFKEKISSRVYLLTFEYISPTELKFLPGHFINLQVGPTAFRSYSICSDYKETSKLSLIISAEHDGIGSNYIRKLNVDDLVSFIGPSGRFLLPESLSDNLVFLATGTGISAFITFFYKLIDINYSGSIKLLFGVRNESEIFFKDLLEKFKSKFSNFNYEICLSTNGNRVTNHIAENINTNAQYFLCGNPNMIEDGLSILRTSGIAEDKIFYEKFTVTKDLIMKNL